MRFTITVFVAALLTVTSPGEEIKVVAHSGVAVNEIAADELRAVFLGTRSTLKQAGTVRPVLNRDQMSLRHFASGYLGKSVPALEVYYRSLLFTGRGPLPVGLATDEAVVAYVARTPGAIGFVRELAPGGAVKTLRVTKAP